VTPAVQRIGWWALARAFVTAVVMTVIGRLLSNIPEAHRPPGAWPRTRSPYLIGTGSGDHRGRRGIPAPMVGRVRNT
jgi:hypothetical protein